MYLLENDEVKIAHVDCTAENNVNRLVVSTFLVNFKLVIRIRLDTFHFRLPGIL